jgi:hypothetical protein
MRVLAGRVVDGKIVVEEGTLAEGAVVTVLAREKRETFKVSSAEESELLKRVRSIEKGGGVAASAVMARLTRKK